MDGEGPKLRQVIASLLVAVAIVAVVVIAVTAELGPTSVAELEAQEEARDQRIDAREERIEELQDRAEERRESR